MASQSISFRPETIIRRIPWQVDQSTTLFTLAVVAVTSLIFWIYLGQASLVTSSNLRVEDLRASIDRTRNQISALELEIAHQQSITRVEERARELGFVPTDPANIEYRHLELPLDPHPAHFNQLSQNGQPGTPWLNPVNTWMTQPPDQ